MKSSGFQSEWLLDESPELTAIDKPWGVALMPDPGRRDTLAARLSEFRRDASLRVVPQLDKQSSGVCLFAPREHVGWLAAQFERGRVHRRFSAILAPRSKISRSVSIGGQPVRIEVQAEHGDHCLVELDAGGVTPKKVHAALSALGLLEAPKAYRRFLHLSELRIESEQGQRRYRAPLPVGFAAEMGGDTDVGALLLASLCRRHSIFTDSETNAFRLAHGAGDGVPGYYVDAYDGHLVLHAHSERAVFSEEAMVEGLGLLAAKSVYIKRRPKTSRRVASEAVELRCPPEPVLGLAAPEPLSVLEGGVAYQVTLGDGMSTGIFLDQRENRERVRTRAQGQRVLNLFGYTGAFSVAAAAGGAAHVTTVDMSGPALDRCRAAFTHAGVEDVSHSILKQDVFEYLAELQRQLELHQGAGFERHTRFDLVIVDPPTFSTTKRNRFSGGADWKRLFRLALSATAPGGFILACSNDRRTHERKFVRLAEEALAEGGRASRVRSAETPEDFPREPDLGPHLKTLGIQLDPK